MNTVQKQKITARLRLYCDRYESQNKASASMTGVSAAIASQIGYKEENWTPVETRDFRLITKMLTDAQKNSLVLAITGDAGAGKTFTVRHFSESNKRVYMLCCNEYWNRKLFLSELLMAMGRDYSGYTVGEMMLEVVR